MINLFFSSQNSITKYCYLPILCLLITQPLCSRDTEDEKEKKIEFNWDVYNKNERIKMIKNCFKHGEAIFEGVQFNSPNTIDSEMLESRLDVAKIDQIMKELEVIKEYIAYLLVKGKSDVVEDLINQLVKKGKRNPTNLFQEIFHEKFTSFLYYLSRQYQYEHNKNINFTADKFIHQYNELPKLFLKNKNIKDNNITIYIDSKGLLACSELNDFSLFQKFMKIGDKQHEKSSKNYWLNGNKVPIHDSEHHKYKDWDETIYFIRHSTFLSSFLRKWYESKISDQKILNQVLNKIGVNPATEINILEKDIFDSKKHSNLANYTVVAEACYKDKKIAALLLNKIEKMYSTKPEASIEYLTSIYEESSSSDSDSSDSDSSDSDSSDDDNSKNIKYIKKDALMGALTLKENEEPNWSLIRQLLSFPYTSSQDYHIEYVKEIYKGENQLRALGLLTIKQKREKEVNNTIKEEVYTLKKKDDRIKTLENANKLIVNHKKKKIGELKKEVDKLTKQLELANNNQSQNSISNNNLTDLQQENESLKEKVDKLNKQLESASNNQNQNSISNETTTDLEKENLKKEVGSLKEQLKSAKSNQNQNNLSNETTTSLQQVNDSLQKKLEQLKVIKLENENKSQVINNLQKENNTLQEKLKNNKQQQTVDQEKDKLVKEIKKYKTQIIQANAQISALNTEIKTYKTQNTSNTQQDTIQEKIEAAQNKAKKRGQALIAVSVIALISIVGLVYNMINQVKKNINNSKFFPDK